ncbi:hypothetical protein [Azospirillum doebereinerae]
MDGSAAGFAERPGRDVASRASLQTLREDRPKLALPCPSIPLIPVVQRVWCGHAAPRHATLTIPP